MKGVLEVPPSCLKSNKSKVRTDLDAWCRSLNDANLDTWMDLNIVDQKINLTPKGGADNYYSPKAMAHLAKILSKHDPEDIPIREWKTIYLLYLNQFFAKTLKGKNNQLSLIYKQKSSITHKPEITFITKTEFRDMVNMKKRFSAQREEEDEATEHIPVYKERVKKITSIREAFNEMRRKRLEAKACGASTLTTTTNVMILDEAVEKRSPPKKKKDKRKRVLLTIANCFLDDNILCPIYNEVTKKPWCNMICCNGNVVHPDMLNNDGLTKVIEFFEKRHSTYHYAHEQEFNAWIPFEYSFEDTNIFTDLLIGRDAWSRIEWIALDCKYILNHIYSVFCSRNEYSFLQVMNFLAHAVQRPWENCNIMLNIQGPQGIGKSQVTTKKESFILTCSAPIIFARRELRIFKFAVFNLIMGSYIQALR